jgi:hypothetical protein
MFLALHSEHGSSITACLLLACLYLVTGDEKLRPWLGDPTWITGSTPQSRFFFGFTSFSDDLYLYGGARNVNGDHWMLQ